MKLDEKRALLGQTSFIEYLEKKLAIELKMFEVIKCQVCQILCCKTHD